MCIRDSVFNDKTTIAWTARSEATGYLVARGTFASAGGNVFDNAGCQGEAATETWSDAVVPALGTGFYYLVAVQDECFASDYGHGTDDTERAVSECP